MQKVRACLDEYNGMKVDSMGKAGGLAFLWRKEVTCTFRSTSVHHMDFNIHGIEVSWRVTGFYGWPAMSDRHLSWELLRLLCSQETDPWLCIGDFNEILYANEMKGGNCPQWQMTNFMEVVDDCGLRDIDFEGYEFTYDNGQQDEYNRQSRIDRAMVSQAWMDMFPRAKLLHLDREWSDHAPIMVILDRGEHEEKHRTKLFRFEQEETFWRQRSRALWLRDRYRNTTYFYRKASQKKKKNCISRLVTDDGRSHVGTEAVSKVAIEYFKGLFTSCRPTGFEDTLTVIDGRVTEEMNAPLREDYSEEEFIAALNQMHPLKAPGLDGINVLFYQTYWHIVGNSVIQMVLDILRGAPILDNLNKTLIVLIPKKKAPDKIVDFGL
ncbi:uncharacterized protein LOC141651878 [Silene latifolia]|uniref:uncharacterized protein LOC141651878 n=1 Tax=Silene latifolia TaxID=37657 RepID=UPI003D787C1B